MKLQHILLVIGLTFLGAFTSNAALVKQDFVNINDGLIVYDNTTNLEWLTPGV